MDGFVGQIEIFPFNFAPVHWARCNGQLLPIAPNTALFSLIGNTYGGDGQTTFALPKLPPLTPVGPFYCICLEGEVLEGIKP
jgi:microcystin-dependent protein